MVRQKRESHASGQPDPAPPKTTSRHDDLPIYVRIEHYLRTLINQPDTLDNGRIPSERALSVQLGASRMTVRKAIDHLLREGLLERRGTGGTWVAPLRVMRPMEAAPQSLSRSIAMSGGKPGGELLDFSPAVINPDVAGRLRLPADAPLLRIRRLRTINDQPFCVETSYLPAAAVPGLSPDDIRRGGSLSDILKSRYKIMTKDVDRIIRVDRASPEDARALRLPRSCSALVFVGLASDQSGRRIEYTVSINHPDLVVFRTAHAEIGPAIRTGTT